MALHNKDMKKVILESKESEVYILNYFAVTHILILLNLKIMY